MDNFKNWYLRNSVEITWWVIGWLSFACLDALGRGNYIYAALDAGLIYINYRLGR